MNRFLRQYTRLRDEAGDGTDGGGAATTPFASFYGQDGLNREAVEALPEEAKAMRSLIEKYPNEQELYRGIQHLRSTASSKGLERLAPDATDDEKHRHQTMVKEYFGVPDQVEGYGVQKPEGIPDEMWDAEGTNTLLGILHQHNASPDLVKALTEHQVGQMQSTLEKAPEQEALRRQEVNQELREAFGNDLGQITEDGKRGLQLLGVEMPESGEIADLKIGFAKIIEMGKRMTELVSEDTQSRGLARGEGRDTAGSYREQAAAIKTDPSNPFNSDFNSEDPARQKRAQAEYYRLLKMADAEEGKR